MEFFLVLTLFFLFTCCCSAHFARKPLKKYHALKFFNKLECTIENNDKLDCGFFGIGQEECILKGCCWKETHSQFPWCFHPKSSIECGFYEVKNVYLDQNSVFAKLSYNSSKCPTSLSVLENIEHLEFHATFTNEAEIRFQVQEIDNLSWKIPNDIFPVMNVSSNEASSKVTSLEVKKMQNSILISNEMTPKLTLEVATTKFSIKIYRDEECLFDSSGPDNSLVFQRQYLKIGTWIPPDANIYGLGENVASFRKNSQDSFITIFNQDSPTISGVNLYGAHPFYLEHRNSKSHGLFLRNSHGMDVIMRERHIYFKVIGGIFDFFLFAGPSPNLVIEQYTNVIGKPFLIPYWSLGFHQCRYGYKSIDEVSEVVERYREHSLPLETMWLDIDYMNQYENFTIDPIAFQKGKTKVFIDKLHSNGQKIIPIIDPGIKIKSGSRFYEEGIRKELFIKNSQGLPFCGSVWPGFTHFPDFLHPETENFWEEGLKYLHSQLDFDGLWLDMNEISSFCNGECPLNASFDSQKLQNSCPVPKNTSSFKNPPYTINNSGLAAPLNTKTIDMDAMHFGDIAEYHIHNLYGYCEAKTTNSIMSRLFPQKRPFLITRSTFSGSGAFTGHWTGDNFSDWKNLRASIASILNFQLFGIPMVGADICGFIGDAEEELCIRWMQLGAFYPFSRNHNSLHSISQEPYRFPGAIPIFRHYLQLRYSLLPFWYTLFVQESHKKGHPIVRPLFFEFPNDVQTFSIEDQFLIGSALLISPCLEAKATTINAYFPKGYWFSLEFDQFEFIDSTTTTTTTTITNEQEQEGHSENGLWIKLSTPLSRIGGVHLRGGSTIVMAWGTEFLTTQQVINAPIDLRIAISSLGCSFGYFYLDDGISPDTKDENLSLQINSRLYESQLLMIKIEGHFGMKRGFDIQVIHVYSKQFFDPKYFFLNRKPLDDCSLERLNEHLICIKFKNLSLSQESFLIIH